MIPSFPVDLLALFLFVALFLYIVWVFVQVILCCRDVLRSMRRERDAEAWYRNHLEGKNK